MGRARFVELMNMVPNIRFNSLVSHDFEKITSLVVVMTHYALKYVILRKNRRIDKGAIFQKKSKIHKAYLAGVVFQENDK